MCVGSNGCSPPGTHPERSRRAGTSVGPVTRYLRASDQVTLDVAFTNGFTTGRGRFGSSECDTIRASADFPIGRRRRRARRGRKCASSAPLHTCDSYARRASCPRPPYVPDTRPPRATCTGAAHSSPARSQHRPVARVCRGRPGRSAKSIARPLFAVPRRLRGRPTGPHHALFAASSRSPCPRVHAQHRRGGEPPRPGLEGQPEAGDGGQGRRRRARLHRRRGVRRVSRHGPDRRAPRDGGRWCRRRGRLVGNRVRGPRCRGGLLRPPRPRDGACGCGRRRAPARAACRPRPLALDALRSPRSSKRSCSVCRRRSARSGTAGCSPSSTPSTTRRRPRSRPSRTTAPPATRTWRT